MIRILRTAFRVLAALVLLGHPPLRAQGAGALAVQSYGPEEGLGNPNVEAIAEDPEGFLWFATEGGLYRFEGRRFRGYGSAEGLEGTRVRVLASDGGAILVGTSAGLFRMAGGRFAPVKGLGRPLRALCVQPDGTLWASSDEGLHRLLPGQAPERMQDWTGPGPSLLVPSAAGVWSLDATGAIRSLAWRDGHMRDQAVERPRGLPAGEPIESLAEDASGRLLLRTRAALWRRSREGAWEDLSRRLPLGAAGAGTLQRDRSGRLWVPTPTGPVVLEGERIWAPRLELGPSVPPCTLTFVDREGTLWLAGEGLHRVLGRGLWQAYGRAQGLPATAARALLRDASGRLYAGTDRGVAIASSIGWSAQKGTEGLRVLTFVEGRRGRIYAAGVPAREVAVLEGGRPGLLLWPLAGLPGGTRAILSMAEDEEGRLWVGTAGQGLFLGRHGPAGLELEAAALPEPVRGESFPALTRDRRGRLWAAGSGGLLCREAGGWRRFGTQNGLPDQPPLCLAQGEGDDLWAGFGDGSLLRLRLREGVMRVMDRVEGVGAPAEVHSGRPWGSALDRDGPGPLPSRGTRTGNLYPEGWPARGCLRAVRAAGGRIGGGLGGHRRWPRPIRGWGRRAAAGRAAGHRGGPVLQRHAEAGGGRRPAPLAAGPEHPRSGSHSPLLLPGPCAGLPVPADRLR
ncbi:MAG: hypothetical protein IPL96_16965 [Holophagaceae bacterium]|nr:hypothetical protein [Holophagaceae bacterium]